MADAAHTAAYAAAHTRRLIDAAFDAYDRDRDAWREVYA